MHGGMPNRAPLWPGQFIRAMHSVWFTPIAPGPSLLCPLPCTQVRLNDACLAILARSCPQLEELVIGGPVCTASSDFGLGRLHQSTVMRSCPQLVEWSSVRVLDPQLHD